MKKFYFLIAILVAQVSVAQIRFQNVPESAHYPQRTVSQTISATIPYQGYDETQAYLGEGEYEIFLDNVNGFLDKPIILLDGFDPGDSRGIGEIYAGLSFGGQNIADILRNEGFDVVVLNSPQYTTGGKLIDGGSDYIQRNAMVLIALIQKLNADKVGTDELVVVGPSMGGVIARYALAYMETNSLAHETRLFISFDAPHRGANIPIGLQYLINYFAIETGDATAQQLVDQLLNAPATKEMLVDHLYGHLLAGSPYDQDPTKLLPAGAPGFRNQFQAELDALGFPANIRNVAMINGSVNGTKTGTPGMTVVDTNIPIDASTSVDLALYFTPSAGQTINTAKAVVKYYGIPVSTYVAVSESPTTTDGVDSSPGGTSSISDALGNGGGNPVFTAFLNALQQDSYSFVPTMSSLAIDNPNWFAIPNLSNSPFAAHYFQNDNQPHLTLNSANAQFALDEIRNGAVGITENQFGAEFILAQNPVKNTINISIGNAALQRLTASVFSITGQKLMEHSWLNPQHQVILDQNLSSGIYLLKLDADNSTQTIKMVVE